MNDKAVWGSCESPNSPVWDGKMVLHKAVLPGLVTITISLHILVMSTALSWLHLQSQDKSPFFPWDFWGKQELLSLSRRTFR